MQDSKECMWVLAQRCRVMCYPACISFRVELPIWVDYSTGMIAMLEKKYLTVVQAANEAGCTVSYVRKLLRDGVVSGEKFGERAWVIPLNQLEKLKVSPTGKPGKPRIGKKS